MPDPLQYLGAIGAAALVATLLVAGISWQRRADKQDGPPSPRERLAVVLGIAGGLVAGYWVLDLYLSWPPVNALDRLLTIVVPLAVAIELLAAFEKMPCWLAWSLRWSLLAAMGRILLHGSIYLTSSYPTWQTGLLLVVSATLTATVWALLAALAERSPSIRIPIALAVTAIGSGLVIMLSGYVSGGAATLPIAAALIAATVTSGYVMRRPYLEGALSIGVISLCGLLFIGRYFGGLTDIMAAALMLAPLSCWLGELPRLLAESDVTKE
jgi:hypothetical protein